MIGATSVTFRGLPAGEIIRLAQQAKLDGLEWGGDVHVPAGDLEQAESVRVQTERAGLRNLSYGSYYRLCQGMDFQPVLDTAVRLGAPNVRVWAGEYSPSQAEAAYRRQAVQELEQICGQADRAGVRISLEYHRSTLTETLESARALLKECGAGNLYTYWQPNPDISHEENCRELEGVLPWLSSVHVFQWTRGNVRFPLEDGAAQWQKYISLAGREQTYILEFVRDDSPEQFLRDAQILREWVCC